VLADSSDLLIALVKQYPDATLSEYCEYWLESHKQVVSESMMCRALQKLNSTRKKTLRSSQAVTDRVQLLRCDYWEKVRDVEPKNMIFLDETGVLLTCRVTRHDGLMRHYARSEKGSRVYDLKPFYRGKKVTVIGAISMSKVLAVMTLDNISRL